MLKKMKIQYIKKLKKQEKKINKFDKFVKKYIINFNEVGDLLWK